LSAGLREFSSDQRISIIAAAIAAAMIVSMTAM
jgi:hypothetical protein